MKKKSKLLVTILAVLSVLSFSVACGSGSSESGSTSDTASNITSDTSSDETSDTSSDETSDTSSDETSDTSSDETSDTSSDETSDSSVVTPETYTVTFKADGKTVATVEYTEENKEITEPEVPAKEHYNGAWEAYELESGDVTVNAVYTAIEYTITFVADGKTVEIVTYTVEDEAIETPAVPEKEGYGGAWEAYELNGGNKTVNAVYTAGIYTVTFKADGKTVATVEYTVESKEITEPEVPVKEHYNGVWEAYELESGDVTVNAVYTAVEYTITFVADGEEVETVVYTVENEAIQAPAVPTKEHYNGVWEDYDLNGGNKTVNAVYTAVEYTITFVANGETVETVTYTIVDEAIQAPAVPTKEHYNGVWEDYDLNGGNKTVNAVYTAVEYTITFVANGETVEMVTYTVEDTTIEVPAVPAKDYYENGAWEAYELNGGNKTVNATYTAIKYTVTFVVDGETEAEEVYTVENTDINVPVVPEKKGYSGKWEEYTLDYGDKEINAIYTVNTYKIRYNANGGSTDAEEQEVTYGSAYVLATATSSKFYQEFLGWYDEEGNLVESGAAWDIVQDVILTAKYSEGITFDSMTEVPSYLQNGGRATLSIVEGNGGKVLQATSENNDQGNVRIMMPLTYLGAFFEDKNVQYLAFDLKLPEGATTPVRSIMYHNLDQTNYTSYETGDPSKSGSQFDTTPTDAYKSYYLPRSVYEAWVANGKTEGRFLNVQAGITQGKSYWIDNIRPVTADGYTADLYSFETGSLRTNMGPEPGFCTPNYNQFQLKFTNVDETTAKFTNEIVSEGMRALTFKKYSGDTAIMFNHNSDTPMELAMREAGYIAFDLYVPKGSDAKIVKYQQPWYGDLKQGWNTVYEQVDATNNELIRFTDTTASTYVVDNFCLLTEEEYNAAKFGFEVGGVIRHNNSNDNETNSGRAYYYAGWDKANNKATIQVKEGTGENDVATLSNVRFATEQAHGGEYSFAFDKKAGYMSLHMAADSAMYASMKNGFTFWIYSTVEMNGEGDAQFINGLNGKLNGGEGVKIEANTWTQVTVSAEDIHETGRFLILQGATEGTIYLDDFQPLGV